MTTLDESLIGTEVKLIPASNNKRLLNHIVDSVAIFVMNMASFFFISFVRVEGIWEILIGMLMTFIYYMTVETLLDGKTLGKYVTKTRAVSLNGGVPSKEAFLYRTLSRLVPFEAFSFFGQKPGGWHDHWSDTMVIDEEKSIS